MNKSWRDTPPNYSGMLSRFRPKRAVLIDSLIESLDQTIEEGAEEAWRREIELRLEQIDRGTVKLISRRDVLSAFGKSWIVEHRDPTNLSGEQKKRLFRGRRSPRSR